jgi:hypothetical protein
MAYLITVGKDARPHAVQVHPNLVSGRFLVSEAGSRTRHNVAAHASVTLLWPPVQVTEYTLIIDGTATVSAREVEITMTRAVLHRPSTDAVAPTSSCGSDCRPLPMAAASLTDTGQNSPPRS